MLFGCDSKSKRVLTGRQCITMGALLNQTMFLILIGLLKGKTGAQIAQSFHDVSISPKP